jgi:putative ABC transport system permease protein
MSRTMSYMVSQRTREIEIRIALGAETSDVRRMVVRHGGRIALMGVAIGIVGGTDELAARRIVAEQRKGVGTPSTGSLQPSIVGFLIAAVGTLSMSCAD